MIRMTRIRTFGSWSRLLATSGKVPEKIKESVPKKLTRQQKIDKVNVMSQSKLFHIDSQFNIFTKDIDKILDLGFIPGNWLEFAKSRMCKIHDLEETDINEKCTFLGFDILFGAPPIGTSSIQGNIYSKTAHKNIVTFFKDVELKRLEQLHKKKQDETGEFDTSYFVKEQIDVESLDHHMQQLTVKDVEMDYKPQLIMSDLSNFFIQERGFWNNTNSRPYLRFAANDILKRPQTDEVKSAIDMADATLVLACDLLRDDGKLIIRLSSVNFKDPEYKILKQRYERVFDRVIEWESSSSKLEESIGEVFLICIGKKSNIDKEKVFMK